MSTANQVDLLVIGGGAAGMTAALTAKLSGLNVLLCEKAPYVGGITATSGGTAWVPGTHLSREGGVPDTVEDAEKFLDYVCAGRDGRDLREAFLTSGPQMIEELDKKTEVKFVAAKAHPDYISGPGEAYGGRALSPVPFDGSVLGENFKRVRPPRKEFMGLGGMMVNRSELDALLNPFRSWANLKTTLSVVLPYFKDRLRYSRGTRLVMGNALVGRLYYSLLKKQVPVWFEASLQELIVEDNRVVGAVILREGISTRVFATKGVVLATGGVGWNKDLRKQFFPEKTPDSFSPESNTGDGISTAMGVGAALDNQDSPALWFPTSFLQKGEERSFWPHIILDRAKPGLFAVNQHGQRFVNESDSYHDFCQAQLKIGHVPVYLICDDDFIHHYGLGLIMPGGKKLAYYLRHGYVQKAATLSELASKINVSADDLSKTAERYNMLANEGEDSDFGRGTSAMNRFNGDASVAPNPCLRPLNQQGPFYALAVRPVDLASSVGLACNTEGQVLNADKTPIKGLFACGNDLASIFKGTYPGPGTTIGPGMVFGWRIAKYAAGLLPECQKVG